VLRNQKGQAMTEFALILPLLLLLILGIVEAARTIWAFINVQQAAREAARYAVTGRPYLDPEDPKLGVSADLDTQLYDICRGNPTHDDLLVEPDPVYQSAQPWVCEDLFNKGTNPDANTGLPWQPRVEAIKQVAIDQGQNLAVSHICQKYPDDTDRDSPVYNGCRDQPGAFWVLVRGQITTKTTTATLVVATDPITDYPGLQGLNVQVNTGYNLQMITPIFDAIMGNEYITLRGSVTLQNEGLDEAAGIEPPPPIPPYNPGEGSSGGSSPPSVSISSLSGYILLQNDLLKVRLANHPTGDSYYIYLSNANHTYQICPGNSPGAVTVNNPTEEIVCDLGAAIGDPIMPIATGYYKLYSSKISSAPNIYVADPNEIEIIPGAAPEILVAGGNTWANNDQTTLTLNFHPTADLYDLKLYDPSNNLITVITATLDISSTNITPWHVSDPAALCAAGGCTIRSYVAGDTTEVARTTVKINQPYITLSKGTGPYARGETVYVRLFSHTPNRPYTVLVNGATQESLATIATNADGDTTIPVIWDIPSDCGGIAGAWPDATDYVVTSHPAGNTTAGSEITTYPNIEIKTPSKPFLTVIGGNSWPIGSFINIKLHKHASNAVHYLEFNGEQVGGLGHTFFTDGCGEAVEGYSIPIGLTPGLTYTIQSFNPASSTTVAQASTYVYVTSQPIIRVLEGDTVLANSVITIQLLGHNPNYNYDIYYDNKLLAQVSTNEFGFKEFTYDLSNLPATPPPDMTNPANYATYPLYSVDPNVSPQATVATTDLTIQGADLAVTQVIVPPIGSISTTVPVDVVVTNLQPVPINHWVDVDLYFLQIPDPDPIAPSYLTGYNFPGNIKYWKDSIAGNEVFTISHQIDVAELGLHNIYGYADTSNTVFEGETAGQVANPNNIGSSTYLANCAGAVNTDGFADTASWNSIAYGTGNVISGTSVAGDVLSLTSTGDGFTTNDDANQGMLYYYRNDSILSSAGLDIQVKITDIQQIANFSTAGIEIRSSLASDGGKIFWGALRNGSGSDYFVAAGSRSGGSGFGFSPSFGTWQTNTAGIDLAANPLWLRVERDFLTGNFNFYFKNDGTDPASPTDTAFWGAPAHTMSVGDIGNEVLVGLMNMPNSNAVAGTSQFQQFSLIGCSGQAAAPPSFPPGYQVCDLGLLNGGFESGSANWALNPGPFPPQGVMVDASGAPANTGSGSLRAYAHDGTTWKVPAFYQAFTMPDWVISTTTEFKVDLFKNAYKTSAPVQSADSFKVVVATSPTTATAITVPAEVANGGIATVGTQLNANNWSSSSVSLQPAAGVNLEDYVGQQLYLFFYDYGNSAIINQGAGAANQTPCGAPGGCQTRFHFDDISLNTCTTQPPPAVISTRIKGQLTLIIGDSAQQLPFVKVWAYRETDQTVYETFTVQGGEFNFYNLPPGDYTIFAQYFLVDPEDQSQVEVLQADGGITLTAAHTDANPATTFLTLYALTSLN